MKNRPGFTIFEVTVVLTLLVLLMGLASAFLPNMLPASRLDATAREISAALKYARAVALVKNEREAVEFDLDAKTYGMKGGGGKFGSKAMPSDIAVRVIDPYAGESEAGKYVMTFQPDGSIEGGTVELRDDRAVVSVRVDPIIGAGVVRQMNGTKAARQ